MTSSRFGHKATAVAISLLLLANFAQTAPTPQLKNSGKWTSNARKKNFGLVASALFG